MESSSCFILLRNSKYSMFKLVTTEMSSPQTDKLHLVFTRPSLLDASHLYVPASANLIDLRISITVSPSICIDTSLFITISLSFLYLNLPNKSKVCLVT